MSFVDVLPVEPVIADDARAASGRAPRRAIAASAACASSGTSAAAAPRASACSTKSRAAADRDEEVALLDPPRVDLHAGDLVRPRPRDEPAERLDDVELERDHRASTSRATARSSNGTLPVGELHLGLGALAGDHDDVARRARPRAPARSPRGGRARSRAAPSGDLARRSPPDPRERGLSVVTIARSASVGGDPAHQRPLLAVAVAARAEDDGQPAVAELPRRAQHVLERVGRVRVVDDHRERLARLDRLEAARERRRPTRCPRRIASSSTPSARAAQTRPERVRAVEPAAQLQVDAAERRRRGVERAIAPGSSAARRRPHSSPTLTTARSAWSKSARFAAKYASIVPWKSRWSCVRFVKTSTREARAVEPPLRAARSTSPPSRTSGRPRRASRGRGAAGRSPRAC